MSLTADSTELFDGPVTLKSYMEEAFAAQEQVAAAKSMSVHPKAKQLRVEIAALRRKIEEYREERARFAHAGSLQTSAQRVLAYIVHTDDPLFEGGYDPILGEAPSSAGCQLL